MGYNMKLEELLKDDQETLHKVQDAIKKANENIKDNNKKIRYTDLGEGNYVGIQKYTDLETKYNEMKDTPNEFETKYNDLLKEQENTINAEKNKLTDIAKKLAVDSAIEGLGINDKLTLAGIKSLINIDNIQLDENYNISGGLDDQIKTIKDTYKDSFNTSVSVVSTGNIDPKNNEKQCRTYSSLAELKGLSLDDVIKDIDNINAQIGQLK